MTSFLTLSLGGKREENSSTAPPPLPVPATGTVKVTYSVFQTHQGYGQPLSLLPFMREGEKEKEVTVLTIYTTKERLPEVPDAILNIPFPPPPFFSPLSQVKLREKGWGSEGTLSPCHPSVGTRRGVFSRTPVGVPFLFLFPPPPRKRK